MNGGLITIDCPLCDEEIQFVYEVSNPEPDIGWAGGLNDATQVDPCECGFKADGDRAFNIVQRELEKVSHWEREADAHGDYLYDRMRDEGF